MPYRSLRTTAKHVELMSQSITTPLILNNPEMCAKISHSDMIKGKQEASDIKLGQSCFS